MSKAVADASSTSPGSKGIRGYLDEYYRNLMNIPGKENDIATGFAIGILISFSPWIGLHLILVFLLTKLFRKSFGAGALASLVFNPLTAPFLLTIEYRTGRLVMGMFTEPVPRLTKISIADFSVLWENIVQVFYPLFIGGLVLGVPASILSFFLVQRALRVYRNRVYGKVSDRLKARQKKRKVAKDQ